MARVPISLPHHSYEVAIEPGLLEHLGEEVSCVAPHQRCALIADETVWGFHGEQAKASLERAGYAPVISIQRAGEDNKTLDTVRRHYNVLLDAKLERKCPVISLGGGVCGDTAGFVAATYLRGVPFIQVPTTLLSMVDASVGGKVGVNVAQGKNLVGSFYQPELVVIDPQVLSTLPERELRCGLAECIKHGAICDRGLFEWISEHLGRIFSLDSQVLVSLLERNVEIKAAVVMEDEKEQGVRAILNFGHTFAHAIENTVGYGVIEHGEAVSLGMVAAVKLQCERGRAAPGLLDGITSLLKRAGLPVRADLPDVETLTDAMFLDKKVQDGSVRLVLIDALGEASVVADASREELCRAWEWIKGSAGIGEC